MNPPNQTSRALLKEQSAWINVAVALEVTIAFVLGMMVIAVIVVDDIHGFVQQ